MAEARVIRFPGRRDEQGGESAVTWLAAGRQEDVRNLQRRCRVQADVAKCSAEAAASLSADADQDGHKEAVKRLQLATLRIRQAQRELRLAEREIQA